MTTPELTPIFSRENILTGLQILFQNVKETPDGIKVDENESRFNNISGRVTNEEIDEILIKLQDAVHVDENSIQWTDSAEFHLTPLNLHGDFEMLLEDKPIANEGESPITYLVGQPSSAATVYLLCWIAQRKEFARSRRWVMLRQRARNLRVRLADDENPTERSLLKLTSVVLRVTTLQITSNRTRNDFESLAHGFLFQAAYNLDTSARIGLDPHLSTPRIKKVRRAQESTFDAPRQSYDTDLVSHYLMGVAAEMPLLEYLSYYHIAEHYFDKVFNADLVDQVRVSITDPSFSVRRSKDIEKIIKTIDRAHRQVREDGVNEQRALELVLEKFVDVDRLISDLDAWDSGIVQHYKTNGVPFAGASKLDLRPSDRGEVKKLIARRIYKVRNALVHAKEGSLPKYAPFAHDAELAQEIPLMRFTAEQIIIKNGASI
ncbi:hypothetical protein ACWFQ8_01690 [Streptomyces sp. NPDC055254]